MFYLTPSNGPTAGQRNPLPGPKYVMGRHPDCDIVIEVGAVSRQHAQVVQEGGQYFLEDLGSRNGTFLNEEAVKIEGRRQLRPGDVIRVCEVSLLFHSDQPTAPAFGARPATGSEATALGLGAVMVDDEGQNVGSTIMSKLDVSSSGRGVHVSASPEVKLAALMEITQSLGRALSLDDVLAQVLKSLFKIFVQADRGYIVLKEADGRLIPRWTRLRREGENDTIRISRTIVRHVMETKEAILSADAASDERFEMSQSIADFRIRSMMCAPLLDLEGNAIGVLQIDTLDQRHRFQKDDLELLVSTAAQAGVAIQNAQLHDAALRQREVERDMQLARDVQRGFLPEQRPNLAGYEFFDYYQPADQVGGDYFDYIAMPGGRLAVLVADVVGHGVAAALLMAKLSAETKFCLFSESNPAAAVTRLNERMCAWGLGRFVTMIMVVLDPAGHRATIVNAGHMAPLHRRQSGAVEEPGNDVSGLPLGITDALPYEQREIEIAPGEMLAMYTDGLNESMDASGALYGIERLRTLLAEGEPAAAKLGTAIVEDVRRYLGSAHQHDDMCLVCVGRLA